MKSVKELKQTVKLRLRYSWGENAAVFFLTAGGISAAMLIWAMIIDYMRMDGITAVPKSFIGISDGGAIAVTVIIAVLFIFVSEPFRYGVKWYRLQQIRGNSVHARSIFSCYGSWKRAGQIFKLNLCLFVRRLYFTLPLAAMLVLGLYLVRTIQTAGSGAAYAAAAAAVLLTGGVICAAAAFNCRFAAAEYLFALDPDASVKDIIEKSVRIAKGKTDYLTETVLSSAKWLPFCVLIFPAVFVFPYMRMMYTAAVNEMIVSYENDAGSGEDAEKPDRDGKRVTVVAE
ncbi:MAG: hypothetical protein K2J11_07325 [Oscillospiraceae bacterium]|nr:hypothetical protein [Oscillospiraceae bacterium]